MAVSRLLITAMNAGKLPFTLNQASACSVRQNSAIPSAGFVGRHLVPTTKTTKVFAATTNGKRTKTTDAELGSQLDLREKPRRPITFTLGNQYGIYVLRRSSGNFGDVQALAQLGEGKVE